MFNLTLFLNQQLVFMPNNQFQLIYLSGYILRYPVKCNIIVIITIFVNLIY